MSLKNKIMALTVAVSGMLGGKTAAQAQEVDSVKNTSETQVKPEVDSLVSEMNDTVVVTPVEQVQETKGQSAENMAWENTAEGKEIISAYVAALEKVGETPTIKPEDIAYIRALSQFNHEVAMIDGTGYEMDREDFKGIVPDSLQNELAKNAADWITPAKYLGKNCNHAVKGNLFMHGLSLDAVGVVAACNMEKILSQDINFVGFEVKKGESYFVSNGGIKVYRKAPNHPYGHIGIAINDGASEISMDSSDKLRQKINEDNYNGVVCFLTSRSKASFATCVAAWSAKYKREKRPLMIAANASLQDYVVNLTPRQVFETAVSCKEKYFQEYTAAINQMPKNHQDQNGYVIGPSFKTSLLASNAQIVRAKKPLARTRLARAGSYRNSYRR